MHSSDLRDRIARTQRSDGLAAFEMLQGGIAIFWTLCVGLFVVSGGFVGLLILWIDSHPLLPAEILPFLLRYRTALTLTWIVLCVCEGITFRFIDRHVERGTPPLVELAIGQPAFSPIRRPCVVIWWIGHLVLSFLLADILVGMYSSSAEKHEAPRWLMAGLSFVVPLVAAMSSNLFVLFAVGAATQNRRIVEWVWRHRWPIDVILALSPFIARVSTMRTG